VTESDFQEIEHTADWALRVRGESHAALFAAAARGMFSLLTDLSLVNETKRVQLELESVDLETLLIDWLNELLYRSEEDGVVFTQFTIHALGIAPDAAQLVATARGGVPAVLDKTIKAATFSSLRIEREASGYRAEIVFDV
jgi:SHS2 domain-containing protein